MATRIRRRRRKPPNHVWHKIAIPVGVLVAVILVAGGIAAAWAFSVYNSAPPLSSLKPVKKGTSSSIYAADGSLIGFIRSNNVRQPVTWEELPDTLKEATIAIEDKNFYEHGALDYEGIARAVWEDLKAGGKPVQGASTITQQLVRNLYIEQPEETIERKLTEAHLAVELEDERSKQWILKNYLNTAPYGTVEGQTAVGAEAAAQTYFSKPAEDLGLEEAAMIAGLPQAPSEYNPFLDPTAATQRRNDVLEQMYDQGYIDASEWQDARESGLGLRPGDKYRVIHDPFLFDLVQQQLIARYGINTVRNGGLKAYTTIDPDLQAKAEEAVAGCYVCYPEGGPAAGLASVDPETGAIVALASTEGYASESQFNFAWQAERQPGSSFKTFVLTTAIKQGIDPDTTYYDGSSPMTLDLPGGGAPWVVNNSEPSEGGTMNLDQATVHSVNVVFAQLDLDVGPEEVTKTAREMGIEAELLSVPAEGIGGLTYGVTPLEMADAYATLANGGIHHDPTAISKVEFPDGHVDEVDADGGKRVLTEGQAYEVTRILEGVITEGTGAGYTSIGCGAEAGKTGTSEELSDAWFVGYTPMYSTAVWVGHPTTREATGYGGPTAGPIWQSYMSAAQGGECPQFEVPETLPDLSAFDSSHTRSASEAYDPSGEELEPEEEDKGKKKGEKEEEEGEESESESEAEPDPEPTPTPTPTPSPNVPPPSVGGGISPG
ncbi:MAG TPA: transglycosylase domain-containing protein [Solirubrobacterales bacterium]|jgi:penicillin-binding protein 1A|nr:transglycosylase domain-containing protein [Solirubrobacterales bacterium]